MTPTGSDGVPAIVRRRDAVAPRTPTATKGWSLDFGVQGYTGKREGVTGNVKAGYRF
ncbi:hypothetical protein AGMMS50225_28330 [Betaproteobacteria bacterium]|nr:hypothetical protein AGMMS50225_28330 [Betaproteobacteria bacterium]